jgi:hypothetical protein
VFQPGEDIDEAVAEIEAQQRAAEFGGRFQEPRGTAEPPKPPPPASTTMTDRVPGFRGNRCTRSTNSASSGTRQSTTSVQPDLWSPLKRHRYQHDPAVAVFVDKQLGGAIAITAGHRL